MMSLITLTAVFGGVGTSIFAKAAAVADTTGDRAALRAVAFRAVIVAGAGFAIFVAAGYALAPAL